MQEEDLILAVKSGSERAYKQLYELWVSRLYRFVFQYLKSEEATDDVGAGNFSSYLDQSGTPESRSVFQILSL